jgi:hypothetical protein
MLKLFHKKRIKFGLLSTALFSVMALAGCGGSNPSSSGTPSNQSSDPGGTGTINVTITNAKQYYSGKTLINYVTAYTVPTAENAVSGYIKAQKKFEFTVSSDGPVTKTISQCAAEPAQKWVIIVEAKDSSGTKHYSDSTNVIVDGSTTIAASITLKVANN